MLKKQYRLPSFRLEKYNSCSADLFTFKYSKNGLDSSRFGFVFSKKFDLRAVIRNQAKRKLRSCIEEIFDNIKPGYDFIFYPKKNLSQVSREIVLEEILKGFKKENLLND